MGRSKAKRKAASKPVGAVAMKAARRCAHAQCGEECTAHTARQLRKEDLPRRAQAALADRDRAIDALRQVTVEALVALERRAGVVVGRPEEGPGEELHDGYPRSTRRAPGMRGRSERLCQVEIPVAGNLVRCDARLPCEAHPTADDDYASTPPPPQSDPAGELGAAKADGEVTETDGTAASVRRAYWELERAIDELLRVGGFIGDLLRNPLIGRGPAVSVCRACEATITGVGNDRARNGYCNGCDLAWRRLCSTTEGAVDRAAFEAERREKRQAA